MKAITKEQQREVDAALDVLRETAAELDAAIEAYNEALEPMRERMEAALSDYNEKVGELRAVHSDSCRGRSILRRSFGEMAGRGRRARIPGLA